MVRFTYRVPRVYYWIVYTLASKSGILGPFITETEARNKAESELSAAGGWEVVPLNTRNKSAASSKLKAYVLHKTKDIELAMQRMRRKPPSEDKQSTSNEIHFI